MSAQEITVDMVTEAFVKTRDTLAEMKKAYEAEVAKLQDLQERRSAWLVQKLNELGAQSVKSAHGTVYKKRKESVTMGDWDTFFGYVQETGQFNLLQHAVSKNAALEIMGKNRENPPPPGVNYVAIQTAGVRRS